jgi:hypothetical protein
LVLTEQGSDPATPAAGKKVIYAKTDGLVYTIDDAGSVTPIGSGGGAGSIRFIEGANSPIRTQESGFEYYEYEPGLGQQLTVLLPVPSGYVAGKPIKVKIKWACASTSGDALINAVATLIRAEVDAYTSTTNQRTTTNTAITMTADNDDELQNVVLDVSSATGEINSVAISALDAIKIDIQESSSTVADNIKFFFDLTEVTFT